MNTPNHQPVIRAELSTNERALLDIEQVGSWREQQYQILHDLNKDLESYDADSSSRFEEVYDEALDEYLESKGIRATDQNYDEIKRLYKDASITKISDDEWGNRPTSRGEFSVDDRSQRDLFLARINEQLGAGNEVDQDDSNEILVTPEMLQELATKKHKAFAAKVQGPAFGSGRRKELQEAYDQAEAEYLAALKADYKRQLEEQFEGLDVNEDQKNEFIKELVEEQAKADRQAQYDELMAQGGRKAKWMAKYAELSTFKKIGVGLAAGAAGVGVGMVAGLVGGAVAAAAGAGLVGYRYAKGYALHAASIYKQPNELPKYAPADNTDAEQSAVNYLKILSQDKIKEAEKIKRHAVYWAAGTVAVGAAGVAVGGAVAHGEVFDQGTHPHRSFGWLEHFFEPDEPELDDDVDGDAAADNVDTESKERFLPGAGQDLDAKVPELLQPLDGGTPQEVPGDDLEAGGQEPERTSGEYIKEHPEGIEIEAGEGWYQTFTDLHIPAENQAELLKEIGPKLERLGVAYPMGDLWGISYAGELPTEAAELIVETADEKGFIDVSGVEATPETASVNEPFVVEQGNGYTHEIIDAHKAAGIEIDPHAAYELHKEIVNEVGSDYIDIPGQDVYSMGASDYETGIASPAEQAEWHPEAADMIQDNIAALGGEAADTSIEANTTSAEFTSVESSSGAEQPTGEVSADDEARIAREEGLAQAEALNPTEDIYTVEVTPEMTEQVKHIVGTGELTRLNDIQHPLIQDIAEGLKDAGMTTYDNGKEIFEWSETQGKYVFNDADGADIPLRTMLKARDLLSASNYTLTS